MMLVTVVPDWVKVVVEGGTTEIAVLVVTDPGSVVTDPGSVVTEPGSDVVTVVKLGGRVRVAEVVLVTVKLSDVVIELVTSEVLIIVVVNERSLVDTVVNVVVNVVTLTVTDTDVVARTCNVS